MDGAVIRCTVVSDGLRQQLECLAVARFDGRKVAAVQRDDDLRIQSLSKRDDGGIGTAERKVGVLMHKIRHAREVLGAGPFDIELAEAAQKDSLGLGA